MPSKGRKRAKGKTKVTATVGGLRQSEIPADGPADAQAKSASSLPSLVATPSILRQILRHVTDSSLFQCMLVNKTFYKVAGALLYREIHFPETDMNKVLRGQDAIEARGTRNRPPMINLKATLLARVRILQISWHHVSQPTCQDLSRLHLETVRFLFAMWCHCADSVHCELCKLESLHDIPCRLISSLNARKVVVTSLRAYNSHSVLSRLRSVIFSAATITIIISPDSHSMQEISAQRISRMMEELAAYRPEVQLRLIVTPWSKTITEVVDRCPEGPSPHLFESGHCSDVGEVVCFASEVISHHYQTTIYMIQSGPPAFSAYHRWDGIVYDLDPTAIREAIEHRFRTGTSTCPKFTIKTRADYLAENITDEIDEEELDRWRKVEKRERAAQELEEFRQMVVEEKRKLKKNLEEVADELDCSLVVSSWLDEWIEVARQRAERDLHLLEGLCIEVEITEEDDLEHGIELWEDMKQRPRLVMELHIKAKEEIYDQLWEDWSLGRPTMLR